MRILFGGVRGTTPRAEPAFQRYGGHTTCLLVTGAGGESLLLDAGSGIHPANDVLAERADPAISIVFSHLHLDHVVGLPMLAALFDPDARITLASAGDDGPREALERLLSPPLWPLGLDDVPATVECIGLGNPSPAMTVGGLRLRGEAVPHPNGCTSWRVDEPATGTSLAFATDIEWAAAGPARREALLDLWRGVDLLVMDGHFTADELPDRAGWGHSSLDECVEAARSADAARLLITHHAPHADDDRLDTLDDHVTGLWNHAALARQGMVVDLDR